MMLIRTHILILLLIPTLFAQSNESLSTLTNSKFADEVNRDPKLATEELWVFLLKKSETLFSQKRYQNAFYAAEKSRIIAEGLGPEKLIETCHQLIKVSSFLNDSNKVLQYFNLYAKNYAKESERLKPQKPASGVATGFTYYYLSRLYSDPLIPDTYVRDAIDYLEVAHRLSTYEKSPKADELYILSSIQLGRCFGLLNNRVTMIAWLEHAASKLSELSPKTIETFFSTNLNEIKFLIDYNLLSAFQGINDNVASSYHLNELRKLLPLVSTQSRLFYLFMVPTLNEVATIYEKSAAIEEGIVLTKKQSQYLSEFHFLKLLSLIQQRKIAQVQEQIGRIKALREEDDFGLLIGMGVASGYSGNLQLSDQYFSKADSFWRKSGANPRTGIFLLFYMAEVARFSKDYKRLHEISEKLLELALKNNRKEYLPSILDHLAISNYFIGDLPKAKSLSKELIGYVESNRKLDSANTSFEVIENALDAYKLKMDIEVAEKDYGLAFNTSEQLKARWLGDKISNNLLNQRAYIDPKLKAEIFDLSQQFVKDFNNDQLLAKLSEMERKAIFYQKSAANAENLTLSKRDLFEALEKAPLNPGTAVVSYSFTVDGKLLAFVYQKGRPFEAKYLPIVKEKIEELVKKIPGKIKNLIFFKQEGKQIYDELIAPLGLENVKHLVLVPDDSLWKIPFQALSPDGKTYLIENVRVSYAPSVSVLINQLSESASKRVSFQAFSNAYYNRLFLKYADVEAVSLASLFGARAHLNSNIAEFEKLSQGSDIIHFSMHAEADNERAFNSFLAFKPTGTDDGRLTVDRLLKMKLKKNSLVFLASCDTNNVFKGEGLVSLAWGMMGAGASSVISAQWEANDKSTRKFTGSFYKNYKQGISSSEALQRASVEMINDKSGNYSEPYYWALFTLTGDFR